MRTLALAALAICGCGERLAPQSEVTKLRVLAIRADHPEAAPGDTVNVTALWADPAGGGRDIGFVWAICTIGPATDPRECTEGDAAANILLDSLDLDHASFEIPADAIAPGQQSAVVLVTLLVCAGGLPDLDGVCPEDEFVIAYKRIEVTSSDAPNQNPDIEAVHFAGTLWTEEGYVPVDACPSGDCPGWELRLEPTADAAEVYVGDTPDGQAEIEEELLVSFFSTGGDFDRVRAADPDNEVFTVGWRAPREAGEATVWFVLRDGRGGITWGERTVLAR